MAAIEAVETQGGATMPNSLKPLQVYIQGVRESPEIPLPASTQQDNPTRLTEPLNKSGKVCMISN